MLKKTMLAAMVVAAVAAVAAPTMATAQNWTHHDDELISNEQIHLTGQVKFFDGGIVGSLECQMTWLLQLKAGQKTGTIDQFNTDLDQPGSTVTSKCVAAGFLNSCQVHTVQPTNLPWVIHNETDHVKITHGEIHLTMTGGFCAAKRATITAASGAHALTATPNQPHTVTSFALSGTVNVHLYSQHEGGQPFRTSTGTLSGTQTITEEDKHTYSLT